MKRRLLGFTIIELLIVIVIIGILATVTIVAYNGAQARGRDTRRQTDVANLIKAMELYYSETGSYPTPASTDVSVTGATWGTQWYASSATSWTNAFGTALQSQKAIDTMPVDPKNNAGAVFSANNYQYAYTTSKSGTNPCSAAYGQYYAIIYKLEAGSPQQKIDNGQMPTSDPRYNCATDTSGIKALLAANPTYSYYVVIR